MWPQSSTAKEPFPSAEVKWVCSCNKCIYYMWYSEWILPPPPYLTPGPLALETKQNSDQGSLPEVGRCADRKPPAVSLLLDRERRKLKAASSSFMTCRFVVIHDLKADKRSLRVKDSFLMQIRTDKQKKKKKKSSIWIEPPCTQRSLFHALLMPAGQLFHVGHCMRVQSQTTVNSENY